MPQGMESDTSHRGSLKGLPLSGSQVLPALGDGMHATRSPTLFSSPLTTCLKVPPNLPAPTQALLVGWAQTTDGEVRERAFVHCVTCAHTGLYILFIEEHATGALCA